MDKPKRHPVARVIVPALFIVAYVLNSYAAEVWSEEDPGDKPSTAAEKLEKAAALIEDALDQYEAEASGYRWENQKLHERKEADAAIIDALTAERDRAREDAKAFAAQVVELSTPKEQAK